MEQQEEFLGKPGMTNKQLSQTVENDVFKPTQLNCQQHSYKYTPPNPCVLG
jgi:hypothetical protein